MSITYEEVVNKYNNQTLKFHGVIEWHDMGYKGNGINILNLEGLTDHGKKTLSMIKLVAPEANIYWCSLNIRIMSDDIVWFSATINDKEYDLDEFKVFLKNIDIVTLSKSSDYGELNDILLDNCVCLTSAGNIGLDGLSGAFDGKAIDVGAIYLINNTIKRESYSSINCDFATLHGYYEGTSFSSPVLTGMVALIMQRYNIKSQDKIVEMLKKISIDAGEIGFDEDFGFGIPVLQKEIMMYLNEENILGIPLILKPIKDFSNREYYTMKPDYITIHNFGTDDKAEDVAQYVVDTDEVKSWHFTVGADAIYQHLPLDVNGWHAGCGEYCDGNRKSIGIEIEENEQAMKNAIKLVAYLRLDEKLEIKTHRDWSGKYCPRWILDNYSKDYFVEEVEKLEHWADAYWERLNEMGITVYEKRYDEAITRGEVFALLVRLLEHLDK